MKFIIILLLAGLIEHVFSIQCYTCGEQDFHCPLPLNLDGGDESNENDIETFNYDTGFACVSDHSMNPQTGQEKLILRGIKSCRELNVPNRRVHCCYTNNCNKQLPPMTIQTLADKLRLSEAAIESNSQQHLPSIFLILFFISFFLVLVAI